MDVLSTDVGSSHPPQAHGGFEANSEATLAVLGLLGLASNADSWQLGVPVSGLLPPMHQACFSRQFAAAVRFCGLLCSVFTKGLCHDQGFTVYFKRIS